MSAIGQLAQQGRDLLVTRTRGVLVSHGSLRRGVEMGRMPALDLGVSTWNSPEASRTTPRRTLITPAHVDHLGAR
jgi:hypothetical protein